MARRGGMNHPNRIALFWTVGCGVMSFVGAGFLGFAHTLPQVNIWTHGTIITAMHGHMAFWGAYAMLVLAIISYALPQMTGRKLFSGWLPEWAFWICNIGMLGMTGAFAVAGIAQVYMERKIGMDFLVVQEAVEVHFVGVVLAACLLTIGVGMFCWNFVQYGLPNDEAVGGS
jgi:nitric oxide reductase subunit B